MRRRSSRLCELWAEPQPRAAVPQGPSVMLCDSMFRASFRFFCLFFFSTLVLAQSPEQRASNYLESIRKSPPLLEAFLREMPKGGDLHNHLIGAIYAES